MTAVGRAGAAVERLSGRSRYAVLAAVALVTRLVYLFLLTDPEEARSDAGQYNEIAVNIVDGHGFAAHFPQLEIHETAFRPPVYPYLLSTLYRLTGPDVVAGKLLNVAIGIAVVLLVYYLVTSVTTPAAGFASGLVVAVAPSLVANDVVLLSEPVADLVLVGLLLFGIRNRPLAFGLAGGLLVLSRPSGQAIVLAVLVWFGIRFGWRRSLLALLAAVVVVMPWYVRNLTVVGTPSLYTSNGFNLAAMYSVEAQETGHFVDPVFDPRYEDRRVLQFDEAAWDRRLRTDGIDGLRQNPTYLATNSARNLLATFELWPPFNQVAEAEDGRNLVVRNATLPLFYLLVAAGGLGLWRARRTDLASLSIVLAVVNTVTTMVLLSPPRLRTPLDLCLAIGVGLLTAGVRGRPGDTSDAGGPVAGAGRGGGTVGRLP